VSELDDRVTRGLRELADGAPVDADVWDDTERYVAKHRHRRQAAFASVAVVVVAAVGIGVAANAARSPKQQVNVAHPSAVSTVPPPTLVATASTVVAPTPTTILATMAPSPTTTIPASRAPAPPNACPFQCIGTAAADVDGDGRADHIGYMEVTAPTAGAPGSVKIRVVFADGRVAEFDDKETIYAAWLGATDLNGDGHAEILYMNEAGAHSLNGKILRWDGNRLTQVTDVDGKPFAWTIDSFAFGDTGFRCTSNGIVVTSVTYQGSGDGTTGPWSGDETTYSWMGQALAASTPKPVTVEGRTAASQVYGAHCPGLPLAPTSLRKPS
jgi:hypothetical protein